MFNSVLRQEGGCCNRTDRLLREGEEIGQLLILKMYWWALMGAVHELPNRGHLGADKTREPLLNHFFWLEICHEVYHFCNLCPDCDTVGTERPLMACLILTFLMEEPFKQVAIVQ